MGSLIADIIACGAGVAILVGSLGCSTSHPATADADAGDTGDTGDTGDAGDAGSAAEDAAACSGLECGDAGSGPHVCPNADEKSVLEAVIKATTVDGDVFVHVAGLQKPSNGGNVAGGIGGGFTIPFTTLGFPTVIGAGTVKRTCTPFAGTGAQGCYTVTGVSTASMGASAVVQPLPVTLTGGGSTVQVLLATQDCSGSDVGSGSNHQTNESWTTSFRLQRPGGSHLSVKVEGILDSGSAFPWPRNWEMNVQISNDDDASWPGIRFVGGAKSQQTQGSAVASGEVHEGIQATPYGPVIGTLASTGVQWSGGCQ